MPPGAEGLATVITTPGADRERDLETRAGQGEAGRRVHAHGDGTREGRAGHGAAADALGAPEGVRVYTAAPAVTDSSDRGEVTGQRVEPVTYVCEKPGTYRLPGLTLTWWDLGEKKLKRVRLPSRLLEVEPGAAPAEEAGGTGEKEAETKPALAGGRRAGRGPPRRGLGVAPPTGGAVGAGEAVVGGVGAGVLRTVPASVSGRPPPRDLPHAGLLARPRLGTRRGPAARRLRGPVRRRRTGQPASQPPGPDLRPAGHRSPGGVVSGGSLPARRSARRLLRAGGGTPRSGLKPLNPA